MPLAQESGHETTTPMKKSTHGVQIKRGNEAWRFAIQRPSDTTKHTYYGGLTLRHIRSGVDRRTIASESSIYVPLQVLANVKRRLILVRDIYAAQNAVSIDGILSVHAGATTFRFAISPDRLGHHLQITCTKSGSDPTTIALPIRNLSTFVRHFRRALTELSSPDN